MNTSKSTLSALKTLAHRRPLRLSAALVGLMTLVSVVTFHWVKARPAHAATRRTVCAQDLYVRDAPAGILIGTLYNGQSMNVERYSPSGQWAYGFAYGHVNKYGWVQNGYFCP